MIVRRRDGHPLLFLTTHPDTWPQSARPAPLGQDARGRTGLGRVHLQRRHQGPSSGGMDQHTTSLTCPPPNLKQALPNLTHTPPLPLSFFLFCRRAPKQDSPRWRGSSSRRCRAPASRYMLLYVSCGVVWCVLRSDRGAMFGDEFVCVLCVLMQSAGIQVRT